MSKKMIYLRYALIIFGLVFLFGLGFFMHFWTSGWRWEPPQYEYEQMIMGVYATLGVFLILAAKNPIENLSLIWFTIWSSFVHATIMLLQVIYDPNEVPHLWGDIPALYIVAIVLALLTPRNKGYQSEIKQ